jgi:hypothetical protein
MGAAAAPLMAESVMAESFAVAAPSMFTVTELAPLAAPTFGGLSAAGAEFGTAGLLAEAGTNASILSALGSGVGAGAAPTLAQGIASGAAQGLGGAGAVGVNEALVSANEANAVNSGIQEVAKEVVPKYMEDTVPKLLQNSVAGGYGSEEAVREAMARAAETAKDIVPEATKDLLPEIKAGSAIDKPYISQFVQNAVPGGAGLPGAMTAGAGETPLANGFQQALDFAKANPFSAASMAYSANSLLKKPPEQETPEGYNGILTKYKMSPNFKGRHVNPQDYQYTPKTYAEGGIASFKSGGDAGSKLAMDYYESMQHQQAQNMPSTKGDMGIYYDLDPDTRYLDPATAAQVRMAKINKRSNVQAQNMKRPTPMGQINLSPPGAKAQESDTTTDAAHGGIMHSGLGGYAAGGNPRLLRGPGDGMSDNIPATIAGKQPARLADGEFVVPADVVSHLGNGSTEAGAKILHAMMTKVRKERTGNPKQGKQINPRKFVPA